MLRQTGIVLSCLALALSVYGVENVTCTREDAYQAETEIDNLKSWDALYRHFKRYAACDDGALSEGYSDVVGRLLAEDWQNVLKLKILCDSDKEFEGFVSKHLDITIPADTWDLILINATTRCPAEAKKICAMIKKADDAIKQQIKQDRQK